VAKTWQVILATVAIFLAGLVTGGATALGVVRWIARHPRVNPAQMAGQYFARPGPGQAQQIGPQLMRSFANQLDLTDEQRARIGPIVRRTVTQLGRQRREVQLSSALAIERMQDEIADVLTPDQRTKFEELIRAQKERLQEVKMRAKQAGEWERQAEPVPAK
jgi:Spy/CpxP family protein refolding chaperone